MKNNFEYTIYSDGGSRGNPGNAAYGFIVFNRDNKIVYTEGRKIGITTNNIAEYTGVLKALEYLSKIISNPATKIQFYLDSALVVEQLSGNFKIKNERLISLADMIKQIINSKQISATFTHIRREENKEADKIVNEALDNT